MSEPAAAFTFLLFHLDLLQVKVADNVTMSDRAAAEVARWMVSAGRHSHQSMLPWLWEVLSEDDMAHAPGGLNAAAMQVVLPCMGPFGFVKGHVC
jgi:hypothetical protein